MGEDAVVRAAGDDMTGASMLRRGRWLEAATLGWNVVGVVVLAATPNPVLVAEGRVTTVDAILALAVLAGLVLNLAAGWWWADPAAGYVLVFYAVREAREIFGSSAGDPRTASPGAAQG